MAEHGGDRIVRATRAALGRAKGRGSAEVTPDDLLVGLLKEVARFGIAPIGEWTIDLEALGEAASEETAPRAKQKPAYAPETAALFDRAAGIARSDGAIRVGLVHLLAAFAYEDRGLMGRLKSTYGFTGADWRAALARWSPPEPNGADRSGGGADGRQERGPWGRGLLSPDEAAEFLGVHTQTVRSYIRAGKLKAYRIGGERFIRIRRDDLLDLLEPLSPEEAGLSGEERTE